MGCQDSRRRNRNLSTFCCPRFRLQLCLRLVLVWHGCVGGMCQNGHRGRGQLMMMMLDTRLSTLHPSGHKYHSSPHINSHFLLEACDARMRRDDLESEREEQHRQGIAQVPENILSRGLIQAHCKSPKKREINACPQGEENSSYSTRSQP